MDLYNENKLLSFEELKNKSDIPRTHLFKYLQLRFFIYANAHSNIQPPLSISENLALNNCFGRGRLCPSISYWLKELSGCLVLEKLTYSLKKKSAKFQDVWSPFLSFLENYSLRNPQEILQSELFC